MTTEALQTTGEAIVASPIATSERSKAVNRLLYILLCAGLLRSPRRNKVIVEDEITVDPADIVAASIGMISVDISQAISDNKCREQHPDEQFRHWTDQHRVILNNEDKVKLSLTFVDLPDTH